MTYLTLRQWERGERGEVPGVRVVASARGWSSTHGPGRRRILPPLVFGLGVLLAPAAARPPLRRRPHRVVPLLLAARRRACVRRLGGFGLVVDWHEVWTRDYWIEYLGRAGGRIGDAVQALCLRVPQRAFCFSAAARAPPPRRRGCGARSTVLEGEYAGPLEPHEPVPPEPLVVFAGRHIPEKRVPALVPAIGRAAGEPTATVRCVIFGDGPERGRGAGARRRAGPRRGRSRCPGSWMPPRSTRRCAGRGCMVLPSRREGYGMIVIEAAAAGTPSVVVRDADNAADELIEEGVNGFVAPSASPEICRRRSCARSAAAWSCGARPPRGSSATPAAVAELVAGAVVGALRAYELLG